MTRELPYPGYSWAFTQHAPGLFPKTLYKLLECAAAFEGEARPGQKITDLISTANILTPNKRGGIASAWRDYQQVLSTLGLVYSPLTIRDLTLTDAGRLLLSGELGFAELMGTQALRLQYPNGNNYVIQARLRAALNETTIPETLMELQSAKGVLIKPGALILRVLLELLASGHEPKISPVECQAFLLPCRINDDWRVAVSEIQQFRTRGVSTQKYLHPHATRNILDWFQFLNKTEYFDLSTSRDLSLSLFSINNSAAVENVCKVQERPESFWIPTRFDKGDRISWFNWFGSFPLVSQGAIHTQINSDYAEENYIHGLEESDADEEGALTAGSEINLRALDLARLKEGMPFSFNSDDVAAMLDRLKQGTIKRHSKTLLHDRIIEKLATRFASQGAEIFEDPDSVDLFARWPNGAEAMFEVKTVTRRNIQTRLRLAIGQIEEYSYRHSPIVEGAPDKVIVLNTLIPAEAWQTDFLTRHLDIGLVCMPTGSFQCYPSTSSRSGHLWGS